VTRLVYPAAALVLVIDQLTKAHNPPPPCPQCSTGADLYNNDLFLGYVPGGPWWVGVLIYLAAIALVLRFNPPPLPWVLLVGGALGNLADILLHGGGHDWMPLGPSYTNIADLSMIVGLVIWAFSSNPTRGGTDVDPSGNQDGDLGAGPPQDKHHGGDDRSSAAPALHPLTGQLGVPPTPSSGIGTSRKGL
jgi:hypothetical protein